MKKILVFVLALFACAALFAQKKESLAIFPFTGGEVSDGDYIASNLSREAVLRNGFNITRPITRATIATLNFEQRFQRNSGLTDADTIFEFGKAIGASHVIAGYITRLGSQKLVLVSIMDVESLQQIAGYYKQYSTLEEIVKLIPEMAERLARAVSRDTRGLPGLSVPPFVMSREVDQNDAMVLAQMLSCDLANAGKYAVLPRTDSLDKVLEEQRRQRDGTMDPERMKRLGVGREAQYVLSGSVEKFGALTQFATDILTIDGGLHDTAPPEKYKDFAEGFKLIPRLAAQLSGVSVSILDPPPPPPQPKRDPNLWTLGASAGTSFAPPWLIGTVHTTLAPLRYSFFEIGVDFGMGSGEPEAKYYSLYPFAHYVLFLPFAEKGGWYTGLGAGFMIVSYTFPEGDYSDQIFATDMIIGFNIGNIFDISYTLRTNFNNASNKISVGFVHRFKEKK